MTTSKDVYHLFFDIECKIIKVPTNQDIFHEEYTLEDYQKDVEYHRIGKIHLAEGNEISASDVHEKAVLEFKKILNSGFHRHKLPDIKVVQTHNKSLGNH